MHAYIHILIQAQFVGSPQAQVI